MPETWDGNSLAPTQDERTMATLADALQLIGSRIAPLIIFLIKRQSRFVSFHALQALLLQVCYTVIMVLATVGWFVAIFSTVAFHAANKTAPPPALFRVLPVDLVGFHGRLDFQPGHGDRLRHQGWAGRVGRISGSGTVRPQASKDGSWRRTSGIACLVLH